MSAFAICAHLPPEATGFGREQAMQVEVATYASLHSHAATPAGTTNLNAKQNQETSFISGCEEELVNPLPTSASNRKRTPKEEDSKLSWTIR
jgi:hypothetical protein